MGTAYSNSKQNKATSIHSEQILYKQNFKQSNFIYLFCKAYKNMKLLHQSMMMMSKWALTTSWISFPLQKLNVPPKYVVFYSDKVTSYTYINGDLKQSEEITFQFGSHEVLFYPSALPTQNVLQAAN